MSIFHWKTSNSIGLTEVDDQHQELFDIARELRDAIKEGNSAEIVSATVVKLSEYTKYHFSLEEQLMLEDNYPDYEFHKERHQKLIDKLNELQENLNPEDFRSSLLVLELLINWIQNHILDDDKNYASFVFAKKQ